VNFSKFFFLEVFPLFHLFDNFREFFVVLPEFAVLNYCSEE